MSIYEVLLLAHLGSTAALLVVLWTVIAVQKATAVARTRSARHSRRPAADVAVRPAAPEPALARGPVKDVVPRPGRGVLHPS